MAWLDLLVLLSVLVYGARILGVLERIDRRLEEAQLEARRLRNASAQREPES